MTIHIYVISGKNAMMKGGLGGDTGTGSMCCGYGLDGKIFIRDFVRVEA